MENVIIDINEKVLHEQIMLGKSGWFWEMC